VEITQHQSVSFSIAGARAAGVSTGFNAFAFGKWIQKLPGTIHMPLDLGQRLQD